MKNRKLSLHKNVAKIAVATTVVIFSLLVCTVGTYAWFMSNLSWNTDASHFQVKELDMSIESVTLYKFNYPTDGVHGFDYQSPQDGYVGAYLYDDSAGRNSFGKVVHNDETGQDEWVPVSTMNLYDPLNGIITGRGLLGMNCNAIFKIVLQSSSMTEIEASIRASSLDGVTKEEDEIWLSTCVDFDLFVPNDLNDPRLVTDGYKNYLPDESEEYLPQDYVFENQYEEDYYKFSYLSSLKTSHAHLYANSEHSALEDVTIGTANIAFVNGYATVYVNVNYAPSQLTSYEETVTPEDTVKAIYDFLLEVC